MTSSVGGMSDYTVSGKIREANVALIVLTQSYVSLLPPHANKDQANVLVLNLRNRMIFRAADAECAKQSAECVGKKLVNRRSRSVGSRGVTYSAAVELRGFQRFGSHYRSGFRESRIEETDFR